MIYHFDDLLNIPYCTVQKNRGVREEERNAKANQGQSRAQNPLGCKREIDRNTSVRTRKRDLHSQFC